MSVKLIKDYQQATDWRIKENSNQSYSYSGQNGYVINHHNSQFMLDKILSKECGEAHRNGDIHIHDLSGLSNYCLGLDLGELLRIGLNDLDGSPKHFTTALSQMHNCIYLISQEIAGAVAMSSVDILLAPYAYNDRLSYTQIKQAVQEFVYTINVKGRVGYQCPFTNLNLDITVPNRLKGIPVMIGDKETYLNYDDPCYERCIEDINRAFLETMTEAKRVLAFPVLNIGITKDFEWDSDLATKIFSTMGKIGQPTVNNYVNSDYDPDTTKSMCCSLRLDMTQLMKAGGQFSSNDNSGSIGVITLNLPRYGYEACNNKKMLLHLIVKNMDLAKDALLAKRAYVEKQMELGMYPTIKRFVPNFANFFNTIGAVGLNEMCLNFLGKGIDTPEGMDLSKEVLKFMNNRLSLYQTECKDWYNGRGLWFNAELVPAEGCSHRLAKVDKAKYPDIITANGTDGVYYTRGCWLPSDKEYSLKYAVEHQEQLQNFFSGGANFQYHVEGTISGEAVKSLVSKIILQTSLPFVSISPIISVCPICGQLQSSVEYCEHELTEYQVQELKDKGVELKNVS